MAEPTLDELRALRERVDRQIEKLSGLEPASSDPLVRASDDDQLLRSYRSLSPSEQAALTRDDPEKWHRIISAREREGLRKLFGGL